MLYLTMTHKISYFLCIIFISTFFHNCLSNDTITQNQVFKDGDTLVSNGSSFAFGFFTPGNSKNRYVGIWYNKVSVQTVVWIANRNNPITNGATGTLSLENPGNIVLRDQTANLTLWSANASRPTTGTGGYFVQLLETGNLVLYQGDQNSNIILWQSFDYPTNILLPYMKIGLNRTSGLEWSLTSWKSDDDPGTGDLQLRMNILNGSSPYELFFYQKSARIWRSGPWNGERMTGAPELVNDNNFIFETFYVEDDEEISFSYAVSDPDVVSSLVVNHDSGVMERSTWQENQHKWVRFMYNPQDLCDYYSHCGPFSNCDTDKAGGFECACLPGYQPKVESEWFLRIGSNGCTRNMELGCGNDSSVSSDKGGFIKFDFVKVPDTRNAVVNKGLELRECAELCLKNCSCSGYASADVSHGGSGCITWYGELIDMRQFPNGGQDFYIRVSTAELAEYSKNSKRSHAKRLIVILASSMGGFLLLTLGILVVWRQKDKRQSLKHFLSSEHDQVPLRADQMDKSGDLVVFDLKTLFTATNYFGWENKLGEGGFGSVYKGKLADGKEVAIKRLSKGSGQGIEEFRNEVTLIAKVQHRNLVKLWGCCIERDEKMLVYEHLPNKGLDNFIFDKEKGALLDWRKRFSIILGIARGMVYLHRDSRLRIIHRDLKASNVLLDANLEPKISDFGMARIFNADQIEAKTLRVVGTYGYMSPEYAMQGLFSEKSDVYSYGVLLLEILAGKRNNSYFSNNAVNLPAHVWELWKKGKAMEVVDPIISDSHNHDEVLRCIHVSLLCVQEHAKDRPSMYEVLSMLCNEASIPSASPKQPAFVTNEIISDRGNLQDSSSSDYMRVNMDVKTITRVEAR